MDNTEIQEWIDSLKYIIESDGTEHAKKLLQEVLSEASSSGVAISSEINTPYRNTISVSDQPAYPGNDDIEKNIDALIRWNAVAMVVRAGKFSPELGGHIATYASAAILYNMGFNHFFHGVSENHGGDLLYIQGHSSPGIYARAYLENRLTEEQIGHFRQEVDGKGLTSYPHPHLMPDFWQFPTVSMGLGPLQAIYQARFLKYLQARELAKTDNRKVWTFCGDGEMDEPESLGAITLAGREKLDNLIFVVNCNLQRLDGPVRGNGKIIQELEAAFKGAGWHVIKVLWGSCWDPLFEKDQTGLLQKRMDECVDGEYQNFKAKDGAYTRENFFGKYPELKELVSDMTDEQIFNLKRGGHDRLKVYAAYKQAVEHTGQPVLILTKTVKGFGMGAAGEAQNITHQQKKMSTEDLISFARRFDIPVPEDKIPEVPFYKPAEDSPELNYLKQQREKLGGHLPARFESQEKLITPDLSTFALQLKSSGDRELSTTMAFVRVLNTLMKDKTLGPRVVPIIPDECRTFGMEGMFRQYGIYSSVGQLYEPMDRDQVMFYREEKNGQIFEEGITEPGAFSSWLAAATSYSTNQLTMIPFYIYYSMFGFQRVGDLAWAAGDMHARGFLLGGTAGRTTLAGEGLQHQDGHSHIQAGLIPNCVTYDPTFSYEVAVIIQDGLKRMIENKENVFYYLTLMNENYKHPDMPEGAEEGILKGMYCFKKSTESHSLKVQLMGSGAILREIIAAAELLENEHNISADIWSVTSFNELRKQGDKIERWNRMHPKKTPQQSYVSVCLQGTMGPVIAATDYNKAYADQIRQYVPNHYVVLGTDGFGRSDTRKKLREFFEVNREFIVIAALKSLHDEGQVSAEVVSKAIKKYKINPDKPNPLDC